jgi:hypothetical protein
MLWIGVVREQFCDDDESVEANSGSCGEGGIGARVLVALYSCIPGICNGRRSSITMAEVPTTVTARRLFTKRDCCSFFTFKPIPL